YKQVIQNKLSEYFDEYSKNSSYSSVIWDAMRYTTLLGGKRLRAIMTLEIAKLLGADVDIALPSACAMEIMHAYSLIHDDLPCMDYDD
ncbi:polyprenyl synthetase family protein, partial [bacterium]|nr:polyprenyl synthetase family protein [bacterium]